MNLPFLSFCGNLTESVNRLTEYVEHTAQGRFADRHLNGFARGFHIHASGHSFASGKHDTAHFLISDMLRHFHDALMAVNGYA